ncbi:NusG domain II-containing protein [Wukongibacter baidiensis]|uniref:NusG domain II-containing protein n=1 Tax=Wukongibacter baidiensis TaxID=1723361 RepID=UPI003D7F7305
MKRFDIIIVILVIAIAGGSLGILRMNANKKYEEKYVEVYVDGELIKSIAFDSTSNLEPFTVQTSHGINVIKIEEGMVKITEADCPDQICIKDGPIGEPSEMLVCLPHKVVVEVKGKNQEKIDEMSY